MSDCCAGLITFLRDDLDPKTASPGNMPSTSPGRQDPDRPVAPSRMLEVKAAALTSERSLTSDIESDSKIKSGG